MNDIKVIESKKLSVDEFDKRYIIVDRKSGEVLDDAQGYGYKTIKKAYAAWAYKTDKLGIRKGSKKFKEIEKWLDENKDFRNAIDIYCLDALKGCYGPNFKFDDKFIKKLLDENKIETKFTSKEIFIVWKNTH